MRWWWSPRRKSAWLRAEAKYRAARWELWLSATGDPFGYDERQRACQALEPIGWTEEIERRRWNSYSPRARRWTA